MIGQPGSTLEAYPRGTWLAVVIEVCQAAGFSLEPGDAEDIIERMGPPYEIPRVVKRARGITLARSAAAEESPRARYGHPRGEAHGLLDWSESAAKAAKQQDWESPFARRAKGAQARRATAKADFLVLQAQAQERQARDEAAAQARLAQAQAEAEARALAKTLPRIHDSRMLDRIAALPVTLEDLICPAAVDGLSDAHAVARLAEYRQSIKGLVAGRAVSKAPAAQRTYVMDRLYRAAADNLRRWERDLAARVREIQARERASRPPPAPKTARKPESTRPSQHRIPAEARPVQPWLLRGVELNNILLISKAERRQWIREGRIPAAGHYEGRMPNGHWYYGTLHDPEVIKALRPRIPEWRAERKAQRAKARRERRHAGQLAPGQHSTQ